MAVEQWRPIKGFEEAYEVSDLGRVRSLERYRVGKAGAPVRVNERILKPSRGAYLLVSLGKGKSAAIHRLVAKAFIPNPESLPEVNHKDGDKHNPQASNLEWTTHRGNAQHASATGLLATGLRHGRNTQPEAFHGRR